ncbi:hypothetical protein HPB50_022958 [Hyalomma asiaticum]|uniref:Uncharacterized protein n=1 Tax=Hyalomma asiaticum TaxID=266040 RepID=A0ACB7SES8_HYAAI|nr:hypothetical protein HPB50_022958 [Hyalomma asiaticum]
MKPTQSRRSSKCPNFETDCGCCMFAAPLQRSPRPLKRRTNAKPQEQASKQHSGLCVQARVATGPWLHESPRLVVRWARGGQAAGGAQVRSASWMRGGWRHRSGGWSPAHRRSTHAYAAERERDKVPSVRHCARRQLCDNAARAVGDEERRCIISGRVRPMGRVSSARRTHFMACAAASGNQRHPPHRAAAAAAAAAFGSSRTLTLAHWRPRPCSHTPGQVDVGIASAAHRGSRALLAIGSARSRVCVRWWWCVFVCAPREESGAPLDVRRFPVPPAAHQWCARDRVCASSCSRTQHGQVIGRRDPGDTRLTTAPVTDGALDPVLAAAGDARTCEEGRWALHRRCSRDTSARDRVLLLVFASGTLSSPARAAVSLDWPVCLWDCVCVGRGRAGDLSTETGIGYFRTPRDSAIVNFPVCRDLELDTTVEPSTVVVQKRTSGARYQSGLQRQERDDPAAEAATTKAEGPALSYRHAFMDLSVPKRAATPPGSSATPQRPLPVPAMVHHVPGSPPAFSATDTAPAAIPGILFPRYGVAFTKSYTTDLIEAKLTPQGCDFSRSFDPILEAFSPCRDSV